MAYISTSNWFRNLTDEEAELFKKVARETNPPHDNWHEVCHPVCVAVWEERGFKHGSTETPCTHPSRIPYCDSIEGKPAFCAMCGKEL